MTDTPNRPPLWREMMNAYCETTDSVARETDTIAIGNAAEIRAVRDYIRHHVPGNGWHTWQVRQLMDLLNTEADRAERGE